MSDFPEADARAVELAHQIIVAHEKGDYEDEFNERRVLYGYLETFTGRELRTLREACSIISATIREINGR